MKKKYENIFESFLFVFILIFIGGFVNAYTYQLHNEYLASMNTGNMARMGIAITKHEYAKSATYLGSIFANAFGATISFLIRNKVSQGKYVQKYQRRCLLVECVCLVVIAFIPLSMPDVIVNTAISCMCGFQLASFTTWEGNVVATTLGSGNIRFMGEHLGNVLVDFNLHNLRTFILFVIITFGFTAGVITGIEITKIMSQYSLFIPCALLLILMIIDYRVTEISKTNIKCGI